MLETINSPQFSKKDEFTQALKFLQQHNILNPAMGDSFDNVQGIADNEISSEFLEQMSAKGVLTYSRVDKTLSMYSLSENSIKDNVKVNYLVIEKVNIAKLQIAGFQYVATQQQKSESTNTSQLRQ